MSTPFEPNDNANGQVPVPPMPPAPSGAPVTPGSTVPAPAPAPAPVPAPAPQGAPYGQPPTGAYPPVPPVYGQSGAGLPPQSDNRPKALGLVSLILAVLGFIAACVGFAPAGLAFALIGGVLLLAAFILSIVTLASKRQGGKGLGIAGLIVSGIGGIVFVFALLVSLWWFAYGHIQDAVEKGIAPAISAPADPSAPTDDASQTSDGIYDEAAYLDDVRDNLRSIIKEVQPGITDDQIDAIYPDDTLVFIGTSLLNEYNTLGDDALTTEAKSMVDSSNGAVTEDQAERFMRAVLSSAQAYLVE